VPGFPHFGHNAHVAWGVTHAEADYQDLYIERFNPAHPHQYEVGGRWREAEVTRSPLHVRGGATEISEVARTRHGPVVAGDPRRGAALALAYTGTQPDNRTFDAIHDLHFVRSADEFEEAMRPWVDPVNNIVYADVLGQFGYRTRGRLPQRVEANAWLPVPGWTDAHEWTGDIPFAELPAVRNPETGFVHTANNRIPPAGYPYHIGLDYLPGFRARRLHTLLRDARDLTVADMARMHADVQSVPALEWRALWPRVRAVGAREQEALELLQAWDGRMTRDSAAAAVFHAFRAEVLRALLTPLLGPLAAPLFRAVDRGANGFVRELLARLHHEVGENRATLLPQGATWEQVLSEALTAAVASLAIRLGPDLSRWRWDALHRTGARHPLSAAFPEAAAGLDPPSIAMGGDGDTVQAAGFYPLQTLTAHLVSMARYAFDLDDWERSTWIVPGGASGHPASPHYQDQLPLYEAHRTIPLLFGWKRIAAEAESVQELRPAG
jgi:penicillin amidase